MDIDNKSNLTSDTSTHLNINASFMDYDYFDRILNDKEDYIDIIERVISFIGVLLNASTIIILLSLHGRLKSQLKLILSLALSDGLIAFLHFILTIYIFPCMLKSQKFINLSIGIGLKILNTSLAFLYTASQFAGLGTMCAITVDIFIKVRTPLRYKSLMSEKRGNIVIICVWIIPSLLLLPISVCVFYYHDFLSFTEVLVFGSMHYCIFCFIYFFVCLPIYIFIFCSIRSFMHRQPSSYRQNISKTAVTFALIMATYFICILPVLTFLFIIFIKMSIAETVLLFDITSCLYVFNTVLDPVIYGTRIPEIRATYERLYQKIRSFSRPN